MIEREQVAHVARLARLEVSDEEASELAVELSAILDHVDLLASVDTDGVEPTTHVIELVNVLRDDLPARELTVEQAIANAPESEDGAFRVPSPQAEA